MALTQVKAGGLTADLIDETKLADNSIDSEHYNDGSIDHEHLANDAVDGDIIADNAVGLAHMASGTDGQIITYDASGNPTAVGPGTDGQVLTSTGAGSPPAFEDVPAGGATINNATANELVTVASTTTQLDAETNLTFDGNDLSLVDGNVIFASGHGISFAATADGGSGNTNNELLNDYEEGGFTPTISIPTGTGAVGTNNCARYQKVGNAVHIWGYFLIDWSEDAAGEITFGGLPYATANLTAGVGGGVCLAQGSHNVTTNLMKFCLLNLVQNSSTFKLFKQTDIDSVERLTVADVNYEPNDATQFYSVDFNYLTMPSGLWY